MSAIVHPNVSEFDALIASGKPVLVDFWAEWCMPCRMLGPVIEQISDKYAGQVTVAKINVDEEPNLAARYRVQSIPTVMIFHNGDLVDTQIGLRPIEAYTRTLDSLIGK